MNVPASVSCPYCGEPLDIEVDTSAGDQQYLEDCRVCCRPVVLRIRTDPSGDTAEVEAGRENE
jgi:hypothetical protein